MSGTADLRNVPRRTVDAKTMSYHDDIDSLASASEMGSRDDREVSLFDEYDAPDEMPASVIYAPRSIGTTGATPLALRLAALADNNVEYGQVPNVIGLTTPNTERVA